MSFAFQVLELSTGDVTNKEKLTVFKKLNLSSLYRKHHKKREKITFLKQTGFFLPLQTEIDFKRKTNNVVDEIMGTSSIII